MNEKESSALSGARAIAIVLVVMGHAIIGDIRNIDPTIDFVRTIIYSFHMFFFFFISGMLFEKGIDKYKSNVSHFIKQKFNLLMVPYIAITIVEYLGLLVMNSTLQFVGKKISIADISIGAFLKALFLNKAHFDTHLWYIYILFFLFFINIIIFRKKIPAIVYVIVVMLVFVYPALSLTPWKLQSLIYYIVPFGLGRVLFSKQFVNKSIEQGRIKLFIYGACILLIVSVIYYLEQIYTGELFRIPYIRAGIPQVLRYVTGILGSMLLLYFGHSIQKVMLFAKTMKILDKYSYEIYLYHQPFVTVGCATILMKIHCPIIVNIFLSTCVGIIVPMLLSRFVFRKNALLRKTFLGNH